jgi:hypothetical protein
MLQPWTVNTLNVLARCHFGGLNGAYTYMLFGQVEFDFAKASFNPIFCKTQVFLSKILTKRTFYYPSLSIKF